MVTRIQDDKEFIIAFMEWRQCGQSGFDKFQGEYIFVNDLWIHDENRDKGLLQEMISDVLMKAPEARYCYFLRRKYRDRMSRLFKRDQFERLATLRGVS